MKAIVLLNRGAGSLKGAAGEARQKAVEEALKEADIEAEFRLVSGDELTDAARQAAGEHVDVVIAGGGDGTISAVASGLAGTKMPLGVLPLGTLNHFARDLKIPLDLSEAAAVIAARNLSPVDVGRVNDLIFINNSSLGVYPREVLTREEHQHRRGLSKWLAMSLAVLKTFRRFPMVRLKLETRHESVPRKTPLLFVGNNHYDLELFRAGTRECLDRGELSLFLANTQSRWGMFKLTLRGLFGRLRQARDFESLCLSEFSVETRRKTLHVALDGEVVKLHPPLHYRSWPGALQVCLPMADTENAVANRAAEVKN
ncbi:MAG: diacylglycerol kinase family lipid kinase [Planctomycetota bacterium]|nr:diacylglycerol kinase family lipid kinase [Planctomycetota bacterium]